jgi:hypothetical protein
MLFVQIGIIAVSSRAVVSTERLWSEAAWPTWLLLYRANLNREMLRESEGGG